MVRFGKLTTNEGGTSSVLRTYKFYDIWPSEVSAIELSYDNTDTVEEFTVTFQVQYFTIGETDDIWPMVTRLKEQIKVDTDNLAINTRRQILVFT